MSFVTRRQYFISGHPRGLPLGTLLKETIDGLLTERPLSFFGRYQVCDRLAVARDRYCFAAFGCAEEFCELRLGLYSLYFAHCSTFNHSCQPYRFYHRDLMRLTSHAGTHTSETTGFLRAPMPSISTSTVSPTAIRAAPGQPLGMMSPVLSFMRVTL